MFDAGNLHLAAYTPWQKLVWIEVCVWQKCSSQYHARVVCHCSRLGLQRPRNKISKVKQNEQKLQCK